MGTGSIPNTRPKSKRETVIDIAVCHWDADLQARLDASGLDHAKCAASRSKAERWLREAACGGEVA